MANLALLGGSLVVALGVSELVLHLDPGLLSEEARLRLSWQEQRLSHAARTRPDSAIANAAGNQVIAASVTDYLRAHRSELGLSPAR